MNLAGFTTTRPLRVWYCSVEGCSNAVEDPRTACGDCPGDGDGDGGCPEDQVVSPTGVETADPEAPAPWTGQEHRLVQVLSCWLQLDCC